MNVGTTKQLWNQIRANIEAMYDVRIKYAEDWSHYGYTLVEFEQMCLDAILPAEHIALMNQLPKHHYQTPDTLKVRLLLGSSHVTYLLSLNNNVRIPATWTEYGTHPPIITRNEVVDIAQRRNTAVAQIHEECAAFSAKTKKVYDSAPSVNAIVKSWPAFRDLLPQTACAQLDTKAKKPQFLREVKEGTTLDELSAHMLKAKIGR